MNSVLQKYAKLTTMKKNHKWRWWEVSKNEKIELKYENYSRKRWEIAENEKNRNDDEEKLAKIENRVKIWI